MSPRSSAHTANPSPLVIDTRRLGRRPGSMLEIHTTVAAPARLGLDLIAIEAQSPLDLDLRLESVSEGVLVSGTVSADTAGECSRCLEPFSSHVDLTLTELFAYPDSVTDETTDGDDVYRVDDDSIDLEPAIADAAGLNLPLRPLCSADCPGLCTECGVLLAITEPGHSHEILDPRWAALAEKVRPTPESNQHEEK